MEEENGEDISEDEQFNMLGDLENFFEGQDDTRPKVQERIAKVTERALRGEITKRDEENYRHLRRNTDCLPILPTCKSLR